MIQPKLKKRPPLFLLVSPAVQILGWGIKSAILVVIVFSAGGTEEIVV
jgi:hypothetical protein